MTPSSTAFETPAMPTDSGQFALRNVSIAIGVDRFFGTLTIEPGTVRFVPGGVGNRLTPADAPTLTQTAVSVVLIRGRLLPPWMNSGPVLVDPAQPHGWTGVVLLASWQRRRIVTALAAAGFQPRVVTTLASAGGQVGSTDELARLLRDRA